jgi:hypothetical protein
MNILKKTIWVISRILGVLLRFGGFMALMLSSAWLLAPLGVINSKDIDLAQFSNRPNDLLMNIFQAEMFSGYLFAVTIALTLFLMYLFWQLHEVAVHKAQEKNSTQIQLVFALSLCGLFLHKAWWVFAIIIAFANWKHISTSLSNIISNGITQLQSNVTADPRDVTEKE